MHDILTAWANFYVITGSSAGGLTGLMFVVITLVGRAPSESRTAGISTYSTPTVVHLCSALLVSAAISAPWQSLVPAAALLGLAGIFGAVFVVRAKIGSHSGYQPGIDDYIWYTVLPLFAYIVLIAAAAALSAVPTAALFGLAGTTLLLIFIGIHNAWDIVTFIAISFPAALDETTPVSATPPAQPAPPNDQPPPAT